MLRSRILPPCLIALLCVASTAVAQQYPMRPIRLIVPAAAGSAADVNARIISVELSRLLGQQVVVDNRAGAGGSIGYEMIARSPADGYTLGYATATLALGSALWSNLRYDPDKDLAKIVQFGFQPNLLAVTLALPVTTVPELIAHARANPGKLSYGSSGNGTSLHLSIEMFKMMSGTQILHVPYKSSQQGITELISGQVHLMCDNLGSILPHARAGRIRGIAVTSPRRSAALPDTPTVAETLPGYEVAGWGGLAAPAGLPKALASRLNEEVNKVLALPAVRDKLTGIGYEIVGGTPQVFDAYIRKEMAKWAEVVKRTGAKPD
jgi:tripartite-type tricarboxylate transporter receptor subunit TctC